MNTTSLSAPSSAGVYKHLVSQLALTRYSDRGLPGARILSLLLLLVFSLTTQFLSAAEVTTDKSDYSPGTTVYISGSGFQADETVHCEVDHVDGLDTGVGHEHWEVTADAEGNFATTWYVDPDDNIGASLLLTVKGQTSGMVATAAFTDAPASANLDQGTNGGVGKPPVNPVKWQNGNANENNSHFVEGETIPYHLVLENLSLGTHTVEIEWDIRHSGANAVDFITSFQRISETVNPLLNTQGNPLPGTFVANTFAIPTPLVSTTVGTVGSLLQPTTRFNSLPAAEKLFTIYNGTGATLTYINNAQGNLGDLTANQSATRLSITFTATAPTVVFAWGGHIARRLDWGNGNSAGGVNGSPYHTRLISLDGSGGNQDRSLSAAAVADPPACDVTGTINVCAGSTNTHTAVTDAARPTYLWSLTGNTSGATILGSTTGSTVQVLAGSGGSYAINVAITDTATGLTTTCFDEVRVNSRPDCTITGTNGPLCPNLSGNEYRGVAGMSSYAWSISGNGLIVGASNAQSVSVTAGSGCASAFTVTLTVTNASGCTSTCTKTVSVEDTIAPVLPTLPTGGNLGCNPVQLPTGDTTLKANDNCDGELTVRVVAGAITGTPCSRSQVFTYSATDACTNRTSGTVTYTWKEDTTGPVLPALPTGGNLGCNPAQLPTGVTSLKANDNCDGELNVSVVAGNITGTPCSRSQAFTYSAIDACTNRTSATVTYTWKEDTTGPVLPTLPTGGNLGCNPTPPTGVTTLKANDNCDGELAVSVVAGAITGTPCSRSQVFSYSATDACTNRSSGTVTYTWKEDTTGPVLPTLPTGGNLGCNPTPPSGVTSLKANDNCDGELAVSVVAGNITGTPCSRSQVFTYSATDACTNRTSGTVTYTWKEDTTGPVLPTLPTGGNLGCNPTPPTGVTTLKANDNCDGELAVSVVAGAITGTPCSRSQVFTYSAIDACTNRTSATVTYTWKEDTTGPVLPTLPAGGNLGCNPTPPTGVTTLKANDSCDGQVNVNVVAGAITGTPCSRSQVFTYSATDACTNRTSATVTYTWKEDTTGPVLPTLPTGGNLGCNPTPPTGTTTLKANDNCDGQVNVSVVTGAITGTSCSRNQVFTYSAIDACTNRTSATVTYTWKEDTTGPVLPTLPTGGNLGCNPTPPTGVTTLKANDNCDGELAVSVVAGAITGTPCSRSQVFTYSATDACTNRTSGTVTYIWKEDTTGPVLPTLPTGGNLGCNPTPPTGVTTLKANDNCDGELAVSVVAGAITGTPCSRSQVFTYSATDACTNRTSGTVTYTWKEDTTGPVLPTLPAGGNLGCNPTPPTGVTTLKAYDNCDGELTVRVVAGAITGTPCSRSQVFTYSAIDACTNRTSGTVTYTWKEDTTGPVLPTLPTGGNLGCNPTPPTGVTTLKATDNCDGELAVSVVAGAITGTPCSRSQVFTYSATDACTNRTFGTVTYTWKEDTTGPVLPTLPTGGNLGCNPAQLPTGVTTLKGNDNCDGQVDVSVAAGAITGTPCSRSQVFTYSAIDACTNRTSGTVTYTWKEDTTGPVLPALPAGGNLGCNPTPPTDVATLKAIDNCDGELTVNVAAGAVTGTACSRSQVFTYSATDACTNRTSGTVTYTWKDDTSPPVITCPPSASAPYPTVPVPATTVEELVGLGGSAIDACGAVTISSRDSDPAGACPAIITRTYTATDECGNISSGEQRINQFCPSLVTSSSLCTFNVDPNCKDAFRLNFHQRTDNPSLWRIVSSNPGQYYYNFFVSGAPGDDVNATATIPYPFVTQGAQPVHVYSDYAVTGSEAAGYCLVPGTGLSGFTITTSGGQKSSNGAAIIKLGDYTLATPTTTVKVQGGKIPESGTICVTIHLDYGLKKSIEWSAVSNAAVGTGSLLGVTLNPCQEYAFSFADGVVNDEQVVHSVNAFKKNAGFAASVVLSPELGSTPVKGVKFEAWNSTGTTKIGQAFTGVDGSGLIPYKHKARAEDYWIKVPAYQKAFKVTVKANGFGFGEFEVP